jgi:hypothetical protein
MAEQNATDASEEQTATVTDSTVNASFELTVEAPEGTDEGSIQGSVKKYVHDEYNMDADRIVVEKDVLGSFGDTDKYNVMVMNSSAGSSGSTREYVVGVSDE